MTGPWAVALLVAALAVGAGAAVGRALTGDRARATRDHLTGASAGPADPPAWFGSVLVRAELGLDPGRSWPVVRAGSVAVGLAVGVAVPALGVVAIVASGAVALAAPRVGRRRVRAAFDADLPGFVELIAGRVSAGESLTQALVVAAGRRGPVADDLDRVTAQHARGLSVQQAVDRWAVDRPIPGVGLVADALALAGGSGGSQAGALLGVAATLRERQALAREVQALGAQARASALVLVVTPIAFAGVVALIDARIRHVLLATPVGWACVLLGLTFDAIAAWWVQRLLVAAS